MFRQNAGSNMHAIVRAKNFKASHVILSTNVHRCTYLSRSLFVTLTTVDNRLTHFKTRAAEGLARVTSHLIGFTLQQETRILRAELRHGVNNLCNAKSRRVYILYVYNIINVHTNQFTF